MDYKPCHFTPTFCYGFQNMSIFYYFFLFSLFCATISLSHYFSPITFFTSISPIFSLYPSLSLLLFPLSFFAFPLSIFLFPKRFNFFFLERSNFRPVFSRISLPFCPLPYFDPSDASNLGVKKLVRLQAASLLDMIWHKNPRLRRTLRAVKAKCAFTVSKSWNVHGAPSSACLLRIFSGST